MRIQPAILVRVLTWGPRLLASFGGTRSRKQRSDLITRHGHPVTQQLTTMASIARTIRPVVSRFSASTGRNTAAWRQSSSSIRAFSATGAGEDGFDFFNDYDMMLKIL
jgi:hypothetical protein